jgi:protein-histidine pros-kinase
MSRAPVINKFYIDRPFVKPGSPKAYLAAAILVMLGTALQLLLKSWAPGLPFALLFPMVVITIFLCGSRAGLFAAALSILSVWLLIFPPHIPDYAPGRTLLFSVGAGAVILVAGALRMSAERTWRLNDDLRASEARLLGLLESAPDAMVILNTVGVIVFANARAETLFGHASQALLGKSVDMLLPEQSRGLYLAQLALVAAGPGDRPPRPPIELEGLSKDGRNFPIEVTFGLLGTRDGALISTAIRDITQRRQIEARLAEANKAKTEFLARMSHELRTPLNAIIGFSELIRDGVIAPLDARYRDYGGDINGAGRHLLNIINEILDISKIEAGHLELREETVSLGECIEACQRIVQVMAEAADVRLSIAAASGLPPIRCDAQRFRQVLLNVMSNAVKFTPARGRVSVTASLEKTGLVVTVDDTGIGMNDEQIALAFEPFRQIDGVLNRRFDGTGLGLPLAKALLELHGGTLDISSVPSKGTSVRIGLPLARIVGVAA